MKLLYNKHYLWFLSFLKILFLVFIFIYFSVQAEGIVFKVNIASTACFNGIDDDEDGFMDFPLDSDCTSQDDESEHHLTAACSVSSTSITLGQSVTWTVVPAGWSTAYTYTWSGSELESAIATPSVTYTTIWSKNASVVVTSGVDSLTVDCPDTVTVSSSTPVPEEHTSGGGWSGGSFSVPFPSTEPLTDPSRFIDTPDDTSALIKLNSAPENSLNNIPKTPIAKPQPQKVKIKTHVRLTLRPDRGISLTDEPVPVPPRADNMPLFDVISELSGISMNVTNGWLLGKVAPGELLPVSVKLLNVSGTRRLDVQVYYSVLSGSGESVYSSSETVAVETTASYVKMVQIPYYLIPGVYSVRVSIQYDGQTVPATSHFPFTIETKIGGIFKTTLILYTVLSLLVAFSVTLSLIFLRRKYGQRSRLSPIEYSNIPSNMRTFYEIISDTIMDMRQRVGDQAIMIANSVDGLKIDPESGKVLSLSGNPSKIIAELVSKYELELGKKVSFLFRHPSKK